jgi:hypothetical protein
MAFTSSLNYKETLTQEASGSLTLLGSGSTGRTDLFTINGNNGTLFSVSDDLSNSLFSVNTIAGLPVIEAFADNSVVMGQYGQNVLVVTGSNVGIGTATPQGKLAVDGGNFRFNYGNAATAYYFYLNHNSGQDGGMLWTRDNSTFDWQINNLAANGDLSFYTYGAGSTAVTFQRSSGYVGIGQTNPQNLLHLKQPGSNFFRMSRGSSSNYGFELGPFNDFYLYDYNNSRSSLTILDSGDIGINTNNPGAKLEINGDVGIGIGGTIEPSAALEVKSNTQGFLPPRMTESERDSISGPANGLIIFNSDTQELNVYVGGSWRKIAMS